MAVKFSAFTTRTGTLDASTRIVGYDDPAGTKTNVEFTLATLVANSGIYAADGTIGTTRKALITDTIQFRNAGDTKDVFTLNTTGVFTLGLDAATHGTTSVAVGNNSTATAQYSTIVGNYARVTNSAYGYSTVVGYNSSASGSQAIVLGANSGAAQNSITIGYSSNSAAADSINIGKDSEGSATNSITFNVSGAAATPSTQYAFGVYTTSNTTPDLEVVGSGMSTLNTNLTVKGTDDLISTTGLLVENNSGDDLFFIKNDGTFALGSGAVSSSDDNVVIGGDATDTASSNSFNVIIGKDASITGTGNQGCIILGDSSLGTATGAVAVGSQAKAQAVNAIAIGQRAQPTGANSITLDSSGSGLTTPSTANAFGVYMTSNATPDLEVVGGGESTLRTSLLIPGTESDITINPNQQDCFSIDSLDGAQNDFFTIKRAGATKVQIGLIGSFYGGISLFDNTQATQLQLRSLSTGNFIKPNIHLGDSTEAAEKLEVTGNTKVTGQSYYTIPTALTNATINFNTGNIQEISIPSETATDFTPTNAKSGATYIIKITQAGTSGTMNWESSATVNWPGGTAPTLTATSAGVDIITLVCTVGGATGGTFYGTSALNFS